MKKLIKKALEPEKPFEQWALDNNIELPERNFRKNKEIFIRWAAIAAAVFVICFAVMLPILLKKSPTDSEPQFYMEYDVNIERIKDINNFKELEEFFKLNDIVFFDFDRILNFQSLYTDTAKDNKNLILSYSIESLIITFENDASKGFEVACRIVTYKNYKFMSHSFYSDLTPLFKNNEHGVYYKLGSYIDGNAAYVKFSYGKCDYFLKIKEIEGAGELTVLNLQNFLIDLF